MSCYSFRINQSDAPCSSVYQSIYCSIKAFIREDVPVVSPGSECLLTENTAVFIPKNRGQKVNW